MAAGMPAAVAISEATTFERMPPEPSAEVSLPIDNSSSAENVTTSGTRTAVGSRRGSAVKSPSVTVSSTSRSAPRRIATWAARKSLSPKEISSVVVVSFSLMTGTIRQSSRRRSVWRTLR